MAVVTELVTEFKFKGDTKPLKEAGNQMQRVSENSGVAEARMEGASNSFMGLSKSATVAIAGLAGLATAVVKTAEGILDIGRQTDELMSLGINPQQLRDTEDLFVELGGSAEDASIFVKEIVKAQAQLAGGQEAPFLENLNKQFNTVFDSTESLDTILTKLRANIKAQGLGTAEVAVRAGELGFSPQFGKILLATEGSFQEAIKSSQEYAKVTNEQLEVTRQVNEEWSKLIHQVSRLTDQIKLEFAPALLDAVVFLRELVGGKKQFKTMRKGSGMGMAGLDAPVLSDVPQVFAPFEGLRLQGGSPSSPSQLNNITINVQNGDPKRIRMEMESFLKDSRNRTRGRR